MGHGTMSGCNPTASQQQIPIYLQIRYPAGAICLSVVTYHPASAGRACSVSSALGPPFHALRCGRAVAWHRAATRRTVNGWPSVRMGRCLPARHPALLGLPRPPEPPHTQGRQVLSASRKDQLRTLLFYQQQNNCNLRACAHIPYKLGMTWLQFVLNDCHFLLCTAKASDDWSNALQGDCLLCHRKSHLAFHTFKERLFLHNPHYTRHQCINIQHFKIYSYSASPIRL